MPRSLADPLFERLLRSFPADRAYTRADWVDDAMPDPVAHFLGQLLTHYSRQEARHLRRARSDWVNYDHPEVEQAVRTFFEAVEAHTQVPADEWEGTLRKATHHSTAHLVRPVRVLSDFVFGERQGRLRLPEVLWRMNFFGPYGYLRDAVNAFAEKKDLDRFAADRFEQFLRKIDVHVTADFGAKRWMRLLEPLFQVSRRATERERIPISILHTFFSEKEATAIDRHLRQYEANGHDGIGPKALYRLISDAQSASEPAAPSQPEAPPSDRPPPEPDGTPEPSDSDDEIWGVAGAARPEGTRGDTTQPAQTEDGSTPLWKQFQQGRTTPASAAQNSDADDGEEQPLWAQFRRDRDERLSDAVSEEEEAAAPSPSANESGASSASPSAAETDGALEALEREILGTSNPPHRAVYVRQLFNGDQTAYRQVLRRLRTADSWGEASQIIASDVFRSNKVNIYSDAAVHFTNAVESRFRND
jgi:hypothetical protein